MSDAVEPSTPNKPKRRASAARWAVRLIVITPPWLLAALLLWSERPYTLDLVSHFAWHAAAVSLMFGALLLALRSRVTAGGLLLAACALGIGWRWTVSTPHGEGQGTVIRLVAFNAHEDRSRHDNEAFQWIRDQRPDVIVLIEAPWGVLDDYPDLRREFPHIIEPKAGMMWSVVMLSRFPAEVQPLTEYSEETKFSFASRRSLLVRPPGTSPFLLSAMHPPSPRSRDTWHKSLEGTALNGRLFRDWGSTNPVPIVVAGDFNSTPAGRVHRLFARSSGLRGWSPLIFAGTWPAFMPPWLALPIDRIWTGGGASVRSVVVGPRFRSDHRPLVAEIVLPAAAGEPRGSRSVSPEGGADSVR